jgi:hypothetical protein
MEFLVINRFQNIFLSLGICVVKNQFTWACIMGVLYIDCFYGLLGCDAIW